MEAREQLCKTGLLEPHYKVWKGLEQLLGVVEGTK